MFIQLINKLNKLHTQACFYFRYMVVPSHTNPVHGIRGNGTLFYIHFCELSL